MLMSAANRNDNTDCASSGYGSTMAQYPSADDSRIGDCRSAEAAASIRARSNITYLSSSYSLCIIESVVHSRTVITAATTTLHGQRRATGSKEQEHEAQLQAQWRWRTGKSKGAGGGVVPAATKRHK
jgi:hypothetical protein